MAARAMDQYQQTTVLRYLRLFRWVCTAAAVFCFLCLLVLVHSAGRHLSRLLYGQSGGGGPLPLEQLHQRDLQGLGQGLQQLQVGKSPSCLPF